jgi:hypothetical protein
MWTEDRHLIFYFSPSHSRIKKIYKTVIPFPTDTPENVVNCPLLDVLFLSAL